MPVAEFMDRPPGGDRLTDYDLSHLTTYLRLLDADYEGADWREAVSIIFRMDPERDEARARTVYESHLARAVWMTEYGYRELLKA